MKLVALSATLATLMAISIVPSQVTAAAAKPDLRISAIATPGGICNQKKVRVTVVNSQQAGVSQPIPVILFISQPPNAPSSYVGTLANGIGPNANSGLPVWFGSQEDEPSLQIQENGGPVTIRAEVNPDFEVEESVFNNNDRIITANCTPPTTSNSNNSSNSNSSANSNTNSNGSSSSSKTTSWKLVLRDYRSRPVAGAIVSIGGKRGKTDLRGRVAFRGIKTGKQQYSIVKKGCKTQNKTVRLSKRNRTHTVKLGKQCA